METAILLSSFNGEKFIAEQVRSILQQDYSQATLYIRDDGSTDGTLGEIKKLQEEFPEKIVLLKDALGNLGVKKSFSELLKQVKADYYVFADQDDVWKSKKLSKMMVRMKLEEKNYGNQFPLLVHHDLEIANEKLETLATSFYSYTGTSPSFAQQNTILWRNVIPGCSMMVNAELVKRAGEIPEQAIMHDYWLVLFAHFFGKIIFIPEALTIYRQHGSNSLGAEKSETNKSWKTVYRNIRFARKNKDWYIHRFKRYQEQAQLFCDRFPKDETKIEMARKFIALNASLPKFKRKKMIFFNRFRAGSFKDNVELLFSI